jgi:cytochrome c553
VKARAMVTVVLLSAACVRAAEPPPAEPRAAPPLLTQPGAAAPACRVAAPTRCDVATPDYAQEVRPVLERRCFDCHANGGVAAEDHDFSRLEGLRAARLQVVDEVSACAMPPRSPLPESEAELLLRWASCVEPPG